jgi:hypothetical protein
MMPFSRQARLSFMIWHPGEAIAAWDGAWTWHRGHASCALADQTQSWRGRGGGLDAERKDVENVEHDPAVIF